ncbi:MAG: hypothetical protein LBR14_03675 [Clostridiales Family XIII bacterium]|jgi:Flp pilus assembly protein TadG|nr:hypothetical protein [Clostridiales Family XIII bacterium]
MKQAERQMRGLTAMRAKLMEEKSGTAMVESALYFPLVILCVLFTIYMMIHLYSLTAAQASVHMASRQAAAEDSGVTQIEIQTEGDVDRYRAAAEALPLATEDGKRFAAPYKQTTAEQAYEGGSLVWHAARREITGRWYVIDEEKYVRGVELVKDMTGGEEA